MQQYLDTQLSRNNFKAFLWHTAFLALASNFMDVDTILPALLIESGGKAVHIGLLAAILLGGGSFAQLFFAPYLSNKPFKKKFLLLGINARIFALLGLGVLLFYAERLGAGGILGGIIFFLTIFSLSGAFANVCYVDILGKSIDEGVRKSFFSIRQMATGAGAFVSALLARKMLLLSGYPDNYALLLLTGGFALAIASLGFWKLKEPVPSGMQIRNTLHFLQVVRQEVRENPRLKYFLGFINTQGLLLALLPFVTLYGKTIFDAGAADTGSFLLFKVAGLVSASLLVFFLARHVKYRYLLYIGTALGVLLPLTLLLWPQKAALFPVFLFGGIAVAIYTISMNGVLLELSAKHNRALCSGIAGAGNLLPALFPLAGGALIQVFGFQVLFLLFLLILGVSGYFVYRIDCLK